MDTSPRILEPASAAAWILIGKSRNIRRERALRVWHHDMDERHKWEDDTKYDLSWAKLVRTQAPVEVVCAGG